MYSLQGNDVDSLKDVVTKEDIKKVMGKIIMDMRKLSKSKLSLRDS